VNLQVATDKYLNAVERYAGKQLRHRREIGMLIDCANHAGNASLFERIIFLAKFITSGFDILRRSGNVADETKNLSDEVEKKLQEIIVLMRDLCAVDPETSAEIFEDRLLKKSDDSLMQMKNLLAELTWIKKYSLDGHTLPIHTSSSS
jgi:hypothetical protein